MKHFVSMGFGPFHPLISSLFQTAQWGQREGYAYAFLDKKDF